MNRLTSMDVFAKVVAGGSFSGAARSAGEAVKTSNVGKWHSSNLKRSRAGDRQTAQLGRSAFMLIREGKVFEGVTTYVVGMKGQKWAKGW